MRYCSQQRVPSFLLHLDFLHMMLYFRVPHILKFIHALPNLSPDFSHPAKPSGTKIGTAVKKSRCFTELVGVVRYYGREDARVTSYKGTFSLHCILSSNTSLFCSSKWEQYILFIRSLNCFTRSFPGIARSQWA